MSKFKIGDKVKLVRTDGEEWEWYKNHLGKTFTIKEIGKDWRNEEFAELEENDELMPYLKNLELVEKAYTYEDLKKSPIGTKITFESGIILIKVDKENYKEIKEYGTTRYIELLKGLKDNWQFMNQGKIIKIEEPTYKTVYEVKPEILDNTEKRYLKDVIRPFRKRIKSIFKCDVFLGKCQCIEIDLDDDTLVLPNFEANTMYKGMMTDKKYTLEELGL